MGAKTKVFGERRLAGSTGSSSSQAIQLNSETMRRTVSAKSLRSRDSVRIMTSDEPDFDGLLGVRDVDDRDAVFGEVAHVEPLLHRVELEIEGAVANHHLTDDRWQIDVDDADHVLAERGDVEQR